MTNFEVGHLDERVLAVDCLAVGNLYEGASPVTDVSFSVRAGESFGIVGESGSGKSLTLRAIVDLLPEGLVRDAGTIRVRTHPDGPWVDDVSTLRGRGLSMIFQEPMRALNPTMRVGDLVTAGARAHRKLSRREARALAVELLNEVGLPTPELQAKKWPHQLSGGQRQRVMIAVALAADPSVLLCDEPTTALDVEVQEQILALLDRIRRERGLAIIFVTHDLGVVERLCENVAVMYAGQVVELGPVAEVFARPSHPYTRGLLESMPSLHIDLDRPLRSIAGSQPGPDERGSGCRFADRCPHAIDDCRDADYGLVASSSGLAITACSQIERIAEVV